MPRMDQKVYNKAGRLKREIEKRLDMYDSYGKISDLYEAKEAAKELKKHMQTVYYEEQKIENIQSHIEQNNLSLW